jgi:hypothetical protein
VTKTQQRMHYLQTGGRMPTLALPGGCPSNSHSPAGSTLVASGGGQDLGRLRLKGNGTFDGVPRLQQREQIEDEIFFKNFGDKRLEDLKTQV